MKSKALIVALGACFAAPAHADFYDGWRAYDAGDFARSATHWRAAAAKGDSRSQFRLGELYETGRGVERDPVLALMWYEIAANAGYTEASLAGSLLAAKLTRAQARRARRLAGRWSARSDLGPKVRLPTRRPSAPAQQGTSVASKAQDAPPKRPPESARHQGTVVGPAIRIDGEWSGMAVGSGLCGGWRMPIRLQVSHNRLTGDLDAGHIQCSFSGPVDKAGNGWGIGRCNMHTGIAVMATVRRDQVKGSFTADAVNCSGKFGLQPAATRVGRRLNPS